MESSQGAARMAARTETIQCATEIRPVIRRSDSGIVGTVIRQYGLALSFAAAALLASLALQPLFPHPFLFLFFAAVVASVWFGGTLPELLAVLLLTNTEENVFFAPIY